MSASAKPRPFTRAQRAQNARFLAALAKTGNARLAARALSVHRACYTKRRARDPAFAAAWEEALAAADAALVAAGGASPPLRLPVPPPPAPHGQKSSPDGNKPALPAMQATKAARHREDARARHLPEGGLATTGGEPTIVRAAAGRLQLRQALPGRITRAAERRFFEMLEGTANIRFAAESAGFTHASFLARARSSPAFAARLRAIVEEAGHRIHWEEMNRPEEPCDFGDNFDFNAFPVSYWLQVARLFRAPKERRRGPRRAREGWLGTLDRG